jgi:hypothetical protein
MYRRTRFEPLVSVVGGHHYHAQNYKLSERKILQSLPTSKYALHNNAT